MVVIILKIKRQNGEPSRSGEETSDVWLTSSFERVSQNYTLPKQKFVYLIFTESKFAWSSSILDDLLYLFYLDI